MTKTIETFAAGRVCLFGEHQEILGLESVTMAVCRGVTVRLEPQAGSEFRLAGIGDDGPIAIDGSTPVEGRGAVARAAVRLLHDLDVRFPCGAEVTVTTNLAANAGLGAMASFALAWLRALLAHATEEHRSLEESRRLAELAYRASDALPGARRLDALASVFGGVTHMSFASPPFVLPIPTELPGMVLIRSNEAENRHGDYAQSAERVATMWKYMQKVDPELDLRHASVESVHAVLQQLGVENADEFWTVLFQRDLTQAALRVIAEEPMDRARLGELLNEDHVRLRDGLGGSTPRNEEIRTLALEAGALGVKQTGAANGGWLFAYVPDAESEFMDAMERLGIAAYPLDAASSRVV